MSRNASRTNPLIAVIGATGTGKSQLAVALAQCFNGEIINGDAIQMYAGLPIATNKITEEEKQGIPHHLLGCIGLEDQPWVVGKFVTEASKIIDGIRSRGRIPILVGGTHYYTQSLLFYDSVVREEGNLLSTEEQETRWPVLAESGEKMLEELRKIDPAMAAKWHPNDQRKVRRSLQIWYETGRTASEVYAEQKEKKKKLSAHSGSQGNGQAELVDLVGHASSSMRYNPLIFWLYADSDILKERLNARVEVMVRNGLLDEVQYMGNFNISKAQAGVQIDTGKGIGVAIGFKEFEAYTKGLRNGQTEAQLSALKIDGIDRTQAATRQYAKRQVRWIRLKLLHALRETNSLHRLFLLDSSDVSRWSADVEQMAADITNVFLTGSLLPNPMDMSDTAATILSEGQSVAHEDNFIARTCEMCSATIMTEKGWEEHLKSRKHRGLLKHLRKTERLRTHMSENQEFHPGIEM